MDRVRVPDLLRDFSSFFTGNGHQVYLVGGAVRDMFLGKEADDWDVATDADPERVTALFKRVIPTGIEHGTVTIPFRGRMIECTTFRTEQGYSDGRRPDSIAYAATIEEDLSRRDFTMNAIAVSLPDGLVIDPFGGRADIRAGIIRTVGVASERFAEDGLRPLRGVRFASQLGFSFEHETLSAIPAAIPVTAKVARERVREELSKILLSPVPSTGLRFMEATGLLELVLPELQRCKGVDQKGMHRFDVFDHLLATCDACPRDSLELRLAGLLHDIGKPEVRSVDAAGNYTFYGHETASARIVTEILTRLRYPLKTMHLVEHLVRQHMFHYESHWTDAAIRRFIVRVEPEHIEALFALRRADSTGITGFAPDPSALAQFSERIQAIMDAEHAFSLKDLAVNGRDLIEAGIPAGPTTGKILNELFETVLDDPSLNVKARLMEIARELVKTRYS